MDTSLSLSMTKWAFSPTRQSQYDKKGVQYDKKIYHYDTLSFAQHNNTFSKSLNLSLIAKNKRLLLVIASRLNGKAKHEKALKNDI